MVETFKEKAREQPVETRQLPAIQREQREFHSPLDSLGRIARNLRIPSEQTRPGSERAVARSDQDMRIARNVSALRLEGSTPLHARFLRMLESVQG
ncbi:MAG: hypothetical protein U0R44_06030 [Candidatus Micrarchaeia archaeon]